MRREREGKGREGGRGGRGGSGYYWDISSGCCEWGGNDAIDANSSVL